MTRLRLPPELFLGLAPFLLTAAMLLLALWLRAARVRALLSPRT